MKYHLEVGVEYATKAELVADELRLRILSGELVPGAILRQRVLAAELDVSPTPIREALSRLEAEGLVETVAHRGARVLGASSSRLDDIVAIRLALESVGVRLAAARATDADIAAMAQAHEVFAATPPDSPTAHAANRDFHLAVYAASQSAILVRLVTVLWQTSVIGPHVHQLQDWSIRDHAELVDAIRAHDGERAVAITERHIRASAAATPRSAAAAS